MTASLLYLLTRRVLRLFRSPERALQEAELEATVLRHELAVLGLREKVLEGGTGGPMPWTEATIAIHRRDDPLIAAGGSSTVRPEEAP